MPASQPSRLSSAAGVTTTTKVFVTVASLAILALVALWLQPRVSEAFAPTPVAAFVAIEVEPGGPAVVAPIEIAAGAPFRLHAVLEAETRDGGRVYYTEAGSLHLGEREIAAQNLRRWDRPGEVRMLWFTVEPVAPFFELAAARDLERVSFEELFHPEWSTSWVVEGRLDARQASRFDLLPDERQTFGTQRFQVWIEIFDPAGGMRPRVRFKSWGAAELRDRVSRFPTVTATLAGPAGPASAVFGLPAVGLPPDPDPDLLEEIEQRARRRLLFTQVWVLREVLRRAGMDLEELDWQRLELDSAAVWAQRLARGDLLRVGRRWVLAYSDADENGALGPADLCLDFEEGAAVRRLGDVFLSEGDGEIEWAELKP